MKFSAPLHKAHLLRRYKRFLADVVLEGQDEATVVHCPNPGSMMGLDKPESPVWLSWNDTGKRKHPYTWEISKADGDLVGINTNLPNRLVTEALEEGLIPELSAYDGIRREVRYGEKSRVDFLLQGEHLPDCYLEVKNVHLMRTAGLAEFPDSVTARGSRHLQELMQMVKNGHRAVMLFVVQRMDCTSFCPAADIDPVYANTFRDAINAGVEILCYDCEITTKQITIRQPLPLSPSFG
ncbi:DNA/RNA nuclease SfsA [Fodinicurvata fenggangensis]|uniref:DNA/RNA nuclease SfsA n=1 Tax=Fodinicurvata fenggangensis TaxID=1121830 RepID=UPI00047DB369|nr:DNA/RNA nuclease SfsA [Fodinicurvata fenggangensis]